LLLADLGKVKGFGLHMPRSDPSTVLPQLVPDVDHTFNITPKAYTAYFADLPSTTSTDSIVLQSHYGIWPFQFAGTIGSMISSPGSTTKLK
jgi:hypothetical protein